MLKTIKKSCFSSKNLFALGLAATILLSFFPTQSFATAPTCEEAQRGGIIQCGRSCDDPTTTINEAAPCTLCHGFLLFKNLFDKLLIFIALIGSIIAAWAGLLLVWNRENPTGFENAKKILASVLIGALLIFGSWLIINTFLTATGLIHFDLGNGLDVRNWFQVNCPIPAP